jgi:hypothetical protein
MAVLDPGYAIASFVLEKSLFDYSVFEDSTT